MKLIYHKLYNNYDQKKDIVLNMMFHNVEVLPGLSPYTNTESDCKKYLNTLERFFIFCKKQNVTPVKLSALYEIFKK